jgi:hypothetical protein
VLESVVKVFHDWIKNDTLAGEVLVDVADYSHVEHGPGILLTGHGSDYYLDLAEGRPGLLYARKRAAPPPERRLADALFRTLRAAQLLERALGPSGGLTFRTDELLFRVPDRLVARNDEETRDRIQPQLEAFLGEIYPGRPLDIARYGTAKQPFTLRVIAPDAPEVQTLLERVEKLLS